MDSPESSKPTTTTTCETAAAQDSPIFSYISNLSPIQPVKAPSVPQGFPGLNSPPLVFTSPRLNPHSQPTFLKRAQFLGHSVAKLPGQLEDGKTSVTTVKGHERPDIRLSNRIVASGEKDSDRNSTINDLIQSPSGCHEQLVTDIVNLDTVDSNFSFDSTIKESEYNDQPEEAPTCSDEILVKLEREHNSRIIEEIAVAPPDISQQTEEAHKENTLINISAVEKEINQGDGVSIDHCPNIGPELPVDHDLANQDEEDSVTENVEAGQTATFDRCSPLLSGSMEIGKKNGNFAESTGETLTEPVQTKMQYDLKAFQNRGARRRCLQFEDAQYKVISNRPVQNPSVGEGAKPLSLDTSSMPINEKQNDDIQAILYPRYSLNSSIKIPKPSGIGLHLNSIVNSGQAGSVAIVNVKAAQREGVPTTTDDNKHESHASVAADSNMALSTCIVKPSYNSVVLNSRENPSTPGSKRKDAGKGGGSKEFNNISSKKKRMKSLDSSDNNSCKRCNCKRSRCLKLYCDCFAAGIYCAETCACQECFNRPEYEDTVLETRQKIESRDPFAFAPKVVQNIIEQPASSSVEDGTHFTPASARHKKGCKCRKSMCLKKYCECYQANVGCSDGCRCEGCKNVYGRKGEYGMPKIVLTGGDAHETTDGSFAEKCEMVASGNNTYHTHFANPHDSTPLTPAFEFPNHGTDASKVWFPSGKYFQSPESGFMNIAPHMMSPGSDNNVMISESVMEILDLATFDQESHHGNAETLEEFSAAHNQSAKTVPVFGIPNLQKWADNPKAQSFPAKGNYSSGSSFIWRGSPFTPIPQFSGSRVLQEVESDVDLSNIVRDDTPDILKDSSNSLNTVKVSSPNKKRVSPPRPHDFGSSSSAGLRTGRKFILRAVPSFPPLTPCVDSKNYAEQQASNPEDHNANE